MATMGITTPMATFAPTGKPGDGSRLGVDVDNGVEDWEDSKAVDEDGVLEDDVLEVSSVKVFVN